MYKPLMSYLSQACDLEVYDLMHGDLINRPLLLARYLATTPLTLWRWRQRQHLSSCPTCSRPYSYSLRESHTETCPYLALCFPLKYRHVKHIARYLSREWSTTRTQVALEFKYDPWLIIIATLRNYPDRTYRDAGELVEAVLSLEEAHIPTWNAQTVIDWFSSLPPLPPTNPPVTPTPEPPATPTPSETSAPPPPPEASATLALRLRFLPRQISVISSPQRHLELLLLQSVTSTVTSPVTPVVTSKSRPWTKLFRRKNASTRTQSLQRLLLTPTATPPTSARHQELVNEAFDLSLPLRCKACNKTEANALIIDCGHIFLCMTVCPHKRRVRCVSLALQTLSKYIVHKHVLI